MFHCRATSAQSKKESYKILKLILLLFFFRSYFVPMKNKILLFLLVVFLGGILASSHAMPPKPVKGKPFEEKTEEEKQEAATTVEEQERRITDSGDVDLSSALERGKAMGAREQEEGDEKNENFDLSANKLDETLAAIQQAGQECEEMLSGTHVETLDEGALREKADEVEKQIQYWTRQKSNISNLLATRLERKQSSSITEEQKLSSALTLCRALWMKWDDFFSKIQDEIEKRNGSFIDEGEESDLASVSGLEKPMASLKLGGVSVSAKMTEVKVVSIISSSNLLQGRLENFLATSHLTTSSLVDSQLSLTQGHQQQVRNRIQTLLQVPTDEVTLTTNLLKLLQQEGEKFRKKVKRNWEDVAKAHYSQAESQYSCGSGPEAIQNYESAITIADKAIQLWSETEIFYTKLRDVVGGKVRRFGIRIKEGLKQNARNWQLKLNGISLERKEDCDRILRKLNPLHTERAAVLEQARLVEEVEQNEVGTTCRAIAGNLAAMMHHLTSARDAYAQYHQRQGRESEIIADEIKQEVDRLKPHLETRLQLWEAWRERNFEAQRVEENPANGSTVWKMRFMGPLIRKEIGNDPTTGLSHEIEMAAEYLMVVLKSGQSEAEFCNDLAVRGYPECRLEAVSEEDSLYRLYFQRKKNSWLQTMDSLQNSIQENQLVSRCYPDHMMELDSTPIATQANVGIAAVVAAPVQEPWAFHHEKGLHPPAGLFDLQHPLLTAPKAPIKIAIIDTGIFGSIATGAFKTHDALVGKIAHIVDKRQQQVTSFGYNAVDDVLKGYPEDFHGHGTHVIGIVAAAHGVIPGVAGLAGMPGFVDLIICKWIQPNSSKGLCSDAIKCIKYAEQQGAEIINCSWGRRLYGPKNSSGFTPNEIQDLEDSIKNKPFIVVASAGNGEEGTTTKPPRAPEDVDKINRYPCNFVLPNLISVAGTGKQGKVPNLFSNFGKEHVHLAAPGAGIISTGIKGSADFCSMTGTSQAAPYVTAAVALAKIKYPFLDHIQLPKYLCWTANGQSKDEMRVKHGPLNLEDVLSPQKVIEFLKTQKMTDEEIEKLLNPQKKKKKK